MHAKFLMLHVLCNTTTTTTLPLFNGLFSRTTGVSQHQKDKSFWILLEQEMMGWQWHQLDHMQIICTLLQTDNHASTSPLSFTSQMPFLPPNQECQSTEGMFCVIILAKEALVCRFEFALI